MPETTQEQFDQFMRRHSASLLDFAKPYIGRLGPVQREEFLEVALTQAWEKRAELKVKKTGYAESTVNVLRWWEDFCLKPAALSKKEWRLRTWDRQIEIVPGNRLGKGN